MNKKSTTVFLFTLLATTLFCQNKSCDQNLDHPNYRTVIQVNSTDTIVREYILYTPSNYDASEATPLVINMHGFGDCAANYAETVGKFYDLNGLADQENFIVAYPQGAYRPEKEDNYWEPGDNGTTNIYENDVYFIEQLVSDISNELNVDMDKVFACGYSNGGMMAYSLACYKSDLFSAIGIMSGALLDEDCSSENATPIIKFHGVADGVLPYDGGQWYQSVEEVVNFWLNINNIPSNSIISTPLNGDNVVRDEYIGGDENSCFTLYTIHEEFDKPGDHVWFSEAINGVSPNKIMWDFFNGNCSPISSTGQVANSNPSIKIQPNPFSNQITIESKNAVGKRYSIFNIQGVQQFTGKMNSNRYTIDLGFLSPNIYILNIDGNVQKLVKIE